MHIGLLLALVADLATPPLTADDIIAKTVVSIAANEQAKQAHLTFEKVIVSEDLDKPEGKRLKSTEVYRMFGRDGKMYKQLIEKNGKPMHKKEKESVLFFDTTIGERFAFTLVSPGPVTALGTRCYVLDFLPKNMVEGKSDEQKILNHLVGTAWIDAKKFYIRKIKGHLSPKTTVDYVGPLGIGSIVEFSAESQQEERNGLIVDVMSTHDVKGTSFIRDAHTRETNTYRNFVFTP